MATNKLRSVNKVTASVVAGAVVTIVGAFADLDPEVLSSIQTVVTALLVWFVPNSGDQA